MSATIQTMQIGDIGNEIDGLVDRVSRGETRITVQRGGVPVAALVSPEDLELIDEMGAVFRGVPFEEIERETEKALAEVRAEMRVERTAARAARG